MGTIRRAATPLLLLPLAALLACQEAPPEPTGSEADGTVKAQRGEPGGPAGFETRTDPGITIEPQDPGALVAAVQEGHWVGMWNGLAWDLPADYDGEVAVWGVLVVDGEREEAFLTDPVAPDGEGPADVIDLPGSLFPAPDEWTPGDELVTGSELLPDASAGAGEPLPPVAAFFEGNAWWPQPDDWHPGPDDWLPTPDSWRVNFVIDGIYERFDTEGNARAPGNDVKAQLLIIPLPTERPAEGTVRPAGLLVGYDEVT